MSLILYFYFLIHVIHCSYTDQYLRRIEDYQPIEKEHIIEQSHSLNDPQLNAYTGSLLPSKNPTLLEVKNKVSGMNSYTSDLLSSLTKVKNKNPDIKNKLSPDLPMIPKLKETIPKFLDPANFEMPVMVKLVDLRNVLAEVKRHIRDKGTNPRDYTSSRLLITLLREQCARMAQAGDPAVVTFCNQVQNRFRSFFF